MIDGRELIIKRWGPPLIKKKVKPIVDKVLGGTLRLFVQKVYEGGVTFHVMKR